MVGVYNEQEYAVADDQRLANLGAAALFSVCKLATCSVKAFEKVDQAHVVSLL